MVPNRRRHARQLVTPPVYVAVDGARNGGVLYDVGEGGLAVDLIDPRLAGDPLLLEFDIPETGRHFSAFARVTWANEPGNRVGVRFIDLSQASDLQLKEWIWTKSISPGSANHPAIPLVEATPVPDAVPQPQRAPEPIASHWFKPFADPPPPPAPLFSFPSATILRELAPLAASTPQPLALPTAKSKEDGKPEEVPAAAKDTAAKEAPKAAGVPPANTTGVSAGVTVAKDDGSRIVHDLRSTLSQTKAPPLPEPREVTATAPGALHLGRRRRKVLLTALVLVDLLLLAVAVSVYTSEDWRAGLVLDDLKSRMVSAFSASTALPPPRSLPTPAPVESKVAVKHAPLQVKPQETPATVPAVAVQPPPSTSVPAAIQYDVMDAQNGHHLMGHTSTGITVRYERLAEPEGQNSSTTEPESGGATPSDTSTAPSSSAAAAGHVSQQSSGERPTVQVMPDYPALALQQNIQGKVVLSAIIAKDGMLRDVHLISAPSLLNSAVLNAVKKWRYQPHYQNGEPVEVETQIVVDFSITAK